MRPAYPAENRCCVALIRHTALDEDLRRWLIELGFILLTGVSCGYDPPLFEALQEFYCLKAEAAVVEYGCCGFRQIPAWAGRLFLVLAAGPIIPRFVPTRLKNSII
ncbi:hypothetical protein IG631_03685 [Alternaria alternata]|nr:hypothetical protein IG631_03685 [Alternaria alternata]